MYVIKEDAEGGTAINVLNEHYGHNEWGNYLDMASMRKLVEYCSNVPGRNLRIRSSDAYLTLITPVLKIEGEYCQTESDHASLYLKEALEQERQVIAAVSAFKQRGQSLVINLLKERNISTTPKSVTDAEVRVQTNNGETLFFYYPHKNQPEDLLMMGESYRRVSRDELRILLRKLWEFRPEPPRPSTSSGKRGGGGLGLDIPEKAKAAGSY